MWHSRPGCALEGVAPRSSNTATLPSAGVPLTLDNPGRTAYDPGEARTPPEGRTVRLELDREEDGRWIAEVPDLPGVLVYAPTRQEAISKVQALALRVIADRLDHGEAVPELDDLFAAPA